MRDGDAWVPCYDSLRRGARRGLPRAVRMVFLELALEVRESGTDGSLRLPHGFRDDVDAIHDVLGGERRDVARALVDLTKNLDGDGPMIVLSGPAGERVLTIPSFVESVSVSSSKERMRKLRSERRKQSREVAARGDVTSDAPVTSRPVTCDAQSRVEERREEEPPTPKPSQRPSGQLARPGLGGFEVEAFLAGVGDGVGSRPAPLSFLDRDHVTRGLAKCPLPQDADAGEIATWVRESAAAWSRSHLAAGKAQFCRGWHPAKWVEWLNAGSPDPRETPKKTAASAPAPYHREWAPDDSDDGRGAA